MEAKSEHLKFCGHEKCLSISKTRVFDLSPDFFTAIFCLCCECTLAVGSDTLIDRHANETTLPHKELTSDPVIRRRGQTHMQT